MQTTLLLTISIYLLMLPVIGLIGRRMAREQTLRDFYLAGGGLSVLPLFFTLYATQYSGNTMFGFAGNAYREGPVMFFSAAGMALVIASYWLFARPLQQRAHEHKFVTPADFLRHRYHSAWLVRLVNLVLVATLAGYILTNFKAVGLLAERLTDGQLPMVYAVLGLAIVMAFYESLGGMRSVVMTDVIQGALLLIGCLGVLAATVAVLGGPGELAAAVQTHPGNEQGMTDRQWTRGFSVMLLFGVGVAMYPHAIQRIYAAKNWSALRGSFRFMFIAPLITTVPIILSAMAARQLVPGMENAEADQVIPRLLILLIAEFPVLKILLALFMAAAVAAIMSTIDSALLSLGSIFTQDVFRPHAPDTSQATLTLIGKGLSWVLMLMMAGLATVLPQSIWSLTVIKLEMMCQVLPVIVLGIHTQKLSARPLVAGLLVGCAATLVLKWGVDVDLAGWHAGIVGLGLNIATIAVFALVEKRSGVKPGVKPDGGASPQTDP